MDAIILPIIFMSIAILFQSFQLIYEHLFNNIRRAFELSSHHIILLFIFSIFFALFLSLDFVANGFRYSSQKQ